MTQHIPRGTNSNHPVTLINAFSVPVEESERFLEHWRESAQIMSAQPGFIRCRMHEALFDDVELRFVNVAEWESGEALDAARTVAQRQGAMQRLMGDPELHATPHPADYRVVIDMNSRDSA